ncbi:GPW/gp25 family protein [Haliangium ochraceum]|uniref:GPW/gp25 family protein n=1 Tax=Haliangium ochraceum (strain DSM 14365 / JCM 11303 / SMP-2) TaxID=502025 RepID=D0LX67_HALO1|nr:GPW/gp25 family protein [Haliangium ochraceum]ACY16109.1 GPW/gp25 family protein [Haliangium ochraceum DSM 14365]
MSAGREFLGKGWRFPVAINLTGGISSSNLEENVRESIFIILGTAPGERLMRPAFGCRIHDLMFAPNNYVTAALSEHYCQEALLKFEPRIRNVAVEAAPSSAEPSRLDIRISYAVGDTNDRRNLVYPFYLRQPDEEL